MTSDATTSAVAVIELAVARRFAEIVGRFATSLRSMVTEDVLSAGWDGATKPLGAFAGLGEPVEEATASGPVVVKVPMSFTDGALAAVISLAGNGDLLGFQLAPLSALTPQMWQPPSYADEPVEREVTLGEDELAVGGTLTRPAGDGPWPGVVLLPGSGPGDRDGTLGPNKPLKDLAWGLAARGIASIRADKVTHVHPAQVVADPEFTVLDEYRAATLAAVAALRAEPGVGKIVLLGHSLGGTIAPRLAALAPEVAGIVSFAGGAEPLQWAVVRQVRHIADLDPATAEAVGPVIETMTEQARRVDEGLTADTPSSALPFGSPARYWLDLRDYDPVATAAGLDIPMLLLNGGRDYQVTIADDLSRWRAGLAGRTDVTIREYPADNHFFLTGEGPATPAEYQRPGHVDPAVVADIADWLHGLG